MADPKPKKRITVQSGKAKGRNLQKLVRDKILSLSDTFRDGDVVSTSMGASGEDVKLSPYVRDTLPVSFECKANKAFAVYSIIEQCKSNTPDGCQPVVVLKGDYKKPVAVIDLDYYFYLEAKRMEMEDTYGKPRTRPLVGD